MSCRILTELGEPLLTEHGDNLVLEVCPTVPPEGGQPVVSLSRTPTRGSTRLILYKKILTAIQATTTAADQANNPRIDDALRVTKLKILRARAGLNSGG